MDADRQKGLVRIEWYLEDISDVGASIDGYSDTLWGCRAVT